MSEARSADAKDSAPTPMLRQYFEAKAQAGDALLFFRLGDFYELFYDDARVASELLGITLTGRAKGDDRIPMAGVPFHAARGYVARLVAAGHKVAICDQMEPPAAGKTLVRREIVRLITPGTLLDEESLEARDQLYLAALAVEEDSGPGGALRAAIALIDASTGELRSLPPGTFEAALDELQRARPREVLIPDSWKGTPRADQVLKRSGAARLELRLPRAPEDAAALLHRHLGVATLDGFGLRDPLPIRAAAEALGYLQETQRSAAKHVVRVQVEQPAGALWIDPSAIANLELFRGPEGRRTGTLLSIVDKTLTAAGGRMLARWLSAPLLDLPAIAARQDAVEELSQAAAVREDLSDRLRAVLDIERLLGRLATGQGAPRDLGGLRTSLGQLPLLARSLAACSSPLLKSLAPTLSSAVAIHAILAAALVDDVPPGREPGFVRPGHRADLDELSELAQGGRASIAALEAAEKARTGIHSLKVRYNRVSGFYIEVTKPNLHLVPKDYQRRSSTVGAERFITPQLSDHESKVLSAEERRAALEAEIFTGLVAAVLAQSANLRACAQAAAEADALLSFGRVAADLGWTRPTVDGGQTIELHAARHPVVERALQAGSEGPFVPNDLTVDEQKRLLILTGPNMAGKSTAMRQVALLVLLAQSGSFVPAQRARIGLVDRLFTRVGAADDLARGQSTFMVEMAECARILNQATSRSLLILDEIGRGTSTYDGLAIAWAVAEHIHDQVGARTLFATHYHELCDLSLTKPRAVNLTMAVTEVDGRVVFLRKVVAGAASRSYGIHVARLAGLPETVLVRAREILANIEAHELDDAGRPTVAQAGSFRRRTSQLRLFEKPAPLGTAPAAVGTAPAAVGTTPGAVGTTPAAVGTTPAAEPRAAATPTDPRAAALGALASDLSQLDLARMTPLEALVWLDQQQSKLRRG